ncbi:MAG: nucleoside phosphorylase [Isosphaeraceae bacterium]
MKNPEVHRLEPAPGPADFGVVMAMPIEAGYLSDALRNVRRYAARTHSVIEGELAGKLIVLVVSGPGKAAARRGAEVLLVGHRPRWLISAGFAGGLDPALRRNDLVLADEIIDQDGTRTEIDVELPQIPGVQRTGGRLLTADRMITRIAEKAELHCQHGADLVDMETSALAALARERSLRFLSVRVINDDAHAELPAEVARLLTHTGSYRLGVALRSIWHRPSALKDFLSLHARALEAAARLSSCVERLVETLPPL